LKRGGVDALQCPTAFVRITDDRGTKRGEAWKVERVLIPSVIPTDCKRKGRLAPREDTSNSAARLSRSDSTTRTDELRGRRERRRRWSISMGQVRSPKASFQQLEKEGVSKEGRS